jgi:hypothetical protein
MMMLDGQSAIRAIPRLLEQSSSTSIRNTLNQVKHILQAGDPLSQGAQASLFEMERVFELAERRALRREQTLSGSPPTQTNADKPPTLLDSARKPSLNLPVGQPVTTIKTKKP